MEIKDLVRPHFSISAIAYLWVLIGGFFLGLLSTILVGVTRNLDWLGVIFIAMLTFGLIDLIFSLKWSRK